MVAETVRNFELFLLKDKYFASKTNLKIIQNYRKSVVFLLFVRRTSKAKKLDNLVNGKV